MLVLIHFQIDQIHDQNQNETKAEDEILPGLGQATSFIHHFDQQNKSPIKI